MNDIFRLAVPDKHIRLVWKGINEALVFSDSNTPETSSASNLLTSVKWLSTMQDPILRYLAIQSYHIFESTHQILDIDLESILLKSKEYRAILVECEEQITMEIQQMENQDDFDEEKLSFITTHCNVIRDYQMIWLLAEIFYIKLSSPGYFVRDLQNWLILQQPHISTDYTSLIESFNTMNGDIAIEINDRFWPVVWCLSIHGRKEELLNLLACHTHSNGQAFRAIREIISLMPVFDSSFVKCTIEFDSIWSQWNKKAKSYLTDSYLLGPYPELQILARIIIGDQDVYFERQIIDLIEGCWFYAIASYLYYSQPLADAKTVSKCYKPFKRAFKQVAHSLEDTTADFCSDEILAAIDSTFNMDLNEFVSNLSRNCTSWWLCAHLIDLIEKINPHLFPRPVVASSDKSSIFNENVINSEISSISEHFVIQYATGFVSHPSLVIMGLNYLRYCPTKGQAYINQIIDHMDMPTDRFATMIHSWCLKNEYKSVAKSICKRLSVAAYKQCQLGNSLMWAVKGEDVNFISRIADRLLRELCDSNDEWTTFSFSLMNCLKDMSLGVVGKKMTFVIKFFEIQALIKNQEMEKAARLFINLLESHLVSSHFNFHILQGAKPLLTQEGLFSTNEIYKLLEVLEESDDNGKLVEIQDFRKRLIQELSRACLTA